MIEVTHKYSLGDEVVVTGDKGGWGHGYQPGNEGVIDALDNNGSGELGYRVSADEFAGPWYVAEIDLEPIPPPVTEAELAEVYRILGVDN